MGFGWDELWLIYVLFEWVVNGCLIVFECELGFFVFDYENVFIVVFFFDY